MRTRCPDCATIFRVTSEQLRQKAGKVRCGHCQSVFNAFDHLLNEGEPAPTAAPSPLPEPPAAAAEPLAFAAAAAGKLPESRVPKPALPGAAPSVDLPPEQFADQTLVVARHELFIEPGERAGEPAGTSGGHARGELPPPALAALPEAPETPEESTLAAREAGLVAAREIAETPAYNRWAAGALAGNSFGFDPEPARRPLWPFGLAAGLLLLALLGQLAHHYRGDIVLRLPAAAPLYQALGVAVPLPRNADLIAIEASDLQSDNARGLFVLQATLKNRAAYAQDWPVLELTLTDINDAVVSRRAMYAAEYLPPATSAESFAANGELAVRLWVEAKGIGASGYRLYLFYP